MVKVLRYAFVVTFNIFLIGCESPTPTATPFVRATFTPICRDNAYIQKSLKVLDQTELLIKRVASTPRSVTPFNINEMKQILADFQRIEPPECFRKFHLLELDVMKDTLDALYLTQSGNFVGARLRVEHSRETMKQINDELDRLAKQSR